MAMTIDELKGMTEVIEAALRARGITTSDELLQQAATRSDRHRLARDVGVEETTLLTWANCADLARVKGVADIYAELLERAGIDTVLELATRSPARSLVEGWVEHARRLPSLLSH